MSDYVPQHSTETVDEEPVVGNPPPAESTLFSNKVYDVLQYIALIFLPALAVFYTAVAALWGWPNVTEVVGTIVATDTLLGALLKVSSKQYSNAVDGVPVGALRVGTAEDGRKVVSLEFPGDPHDIDKHDKVSFKVKKS